MLAMGMNIEFYNRPPIPWLDEIIAGDKPSQSRVPRIALDNLCDPYVHVGDAIDISPTALPDGFLPIIDAEGDLVCLVRAGKASLMARMLNELSGPVECYGFAPGER